MIKPGILSIIIGLIVLILVKYIIPSIKRKIYFHPTEYFQPLDYDNFKDIYLEDYRLHGWLARGCVPTTKKYILFCHGNAGNISDRIGKIKKLNNFGHNVLIFDYSGYGKSKGKPSEKQLYSDGETYLKFLLSKIKRKNIIIYGESIGCSVSLYLANKFDIPKIILESPFSSIRDIANHVLPNFLKFLAKFCKEFNNIPMIDQYNGISLTIYSDDDDIIPVELIKKIANKSTYPNKMKGTHNYLIIDWDVINIFITQA